MISLKPIHRASASKASHYYADQKDDYYSRDGGAAQWQGKAAERLGLTGDVDPAQLRAALRGDFGPTIQLSRSVRLDAKARAALDITFSPPKSISIQALIGKDASIIEAHDRAVTQALDFLEKELLRARQTENGVTTMERTGNAAIAKFRHETARPTQGAYSDPQVHTHALVMNLTQRADGTWTAISNEDIYRLKSLTESVYNAALANGLEKSGQKLRYEGKSFELAHISREQIEALSKRTQDINTELALMGESRQTASRGLKQTIALKTRLGKAPEISREALQQNWENQGKELGIDFSSGKGERQKTKEISPESAALIADECLRWAIKHLSERESVMDGQILLKTALDRSHATGIHLIDIKGAIRRGLDRGHLILGKQQYRLARDHQGEHRTKNEWIKHLMAAGATQQTAERQVRHSIARGEFVPTGAQYTTQAAREREKRILQIERDGREKLAPILSQDAAHTALAERSLKPGQLAAGELILSTRHRVVGVQGLAGTGKSHMLKQVIEVAEAAGYTIRAVASYGKQIEALRELGMEARTVASMLEARKKERFTLDDKTVLVVDEAGVVPTRIMERLLKRAEAADARVVLLGDTGQTKAIEAGRPFHQLQEEGMSTALMDDIIRQKNLDLKKAVELAAVGDAIGSLGVLDHKLQAVQVVADNDTRYGTVACRYAALSAEERRETLIITGTNDSRNALNEATHQALGLGGHGLVFEMLTRRDTTQAERRVAKYYVKDDIIQPERDYRMGSLKQGEMYRVVGLSGNGPNHLEVEHVATGLRSTFNAARTTKLSVYELVKAELSAGDWVRVTRNDAALDLVNGARFEVLAVTPTTVTIGDDARRITLPAYTVPLHLDRAYATTSHSAQGLTADRVLINAESFSRTTKQDVYYVAVSRARHHTEIYTDNRSKLPDAVMRHENKTAALDIGISGQRHSKFERSKEFGALEK